MVVEQEEAAAQPLDAKQVRRREQAAEAARRRRQQTAHEASGAAKLEKRAFMSFFTTPQPAAHAAPATDATTPTTVTAPAATVQPAVDCPAADSGAGSSRAHTAAPAPTEDAELGNCPICLTPFVAMQQDH